MTGPTSRRLVRPIARAALLVALATLLGCAGSVRPPDDDVSYPVKDFELTERSGRKVTKTDLLGKVWIASFVLTRCRDGKCQQVTQTMQRLQKELGSGKDVLLVTFTVDPDRDTPDELKQYADRHGADPEKWLFLTGEEDTIDRLMRSVYLRAGDRAKAEKEHGPRLVVVDKEGNMRGSYIGMKPTTADGAGEELFDNEMKRLREKVNTLR